MQANRSSGRNSGVRYAYRGAVDDEESSPAAQPDGADVSTAEPELEPPNNSSSSSATASSTSSDWFDQLNSSVGRGFSSALKHISSNPAVAVSIAAGLAAAGVAAALIASAAKKAKPGARSNTAHRARASKAAAAQQNGEQHAADSSSSGKPGKGSKSNNTAEQQKPGPNSKVKSSRTCAALSDGSAVVMLRPIAADNSCLFNAVGYCMHHSTNRAPFLRQVVSREVSSDPQEYSAAFLGMDNAAYCNWITNPAHWGGGIELSILAAHYRREIAAWNLATGACHVFGEEKGYTKQVMVIYTGTHYDALAIAASPRADQDEDITEFNPRTKKGKMILAAAQQLVKMHLKGKQTHHEQQQQKQQEEKAAKKAAAKAKKAANGPFPEPQSAESSSATDHAASQQLLACGSCGEQLQGLDAAKAHAAATGHAEFEEVVAA